MNVLGKVALGLGVATLTASLALNVSLINKIRKGNRDSEFEVNDIIIVNENEAHEALNILKAAGKKYGSISVADYYETVGIQSVYTEQQYGWTSESLDKAKVVPVKGGYSIIFPKVEVLK